MKKIDLSMKAGWSWFVEGWKLFKKNPVILILGALIWGALELAFIFIPVIGVVLDGLIFPIMYSGFVHVAREIDEDRKAGLKHFFVAFRDKNTLFLLLALGIVIVLFEFASIMLGLTFGPFGIIVLIPLLLMLIASLIFSVPLITFKQIKLSEAMKSSYRSCGHNISAIIMTYIMLVALLIISILTFGVALLVTIPVIFCALYNGYKEIYE